MGLFDRFKKNIQKIGNEELGKNRLEKFENQKNKIVENQKKLGDGLFKLDRDFITVTFIDEKEKN